MRQASLKDVSELLDNENMDSETAGIGVDSSDPVIGTAIRLNLDQLVGYDRNPRIAVNREYETLKESLRNTGSDTVALVVIKRPGEADYFPKMGGNTRIRILKELYDETGDEKYFWIGCKETVSHAYHVLRLTRWLTLITRYTSRFGYLIGNVYGLHTSPATIRQTMELDASYLSFVQYLCALDSQRHARIRALAERVLDGIMQAAGPCDSPVADALSRVIGTQTGDRSTNVYYRAAATDPFENAAGSLEYLSDIPPPGTGGPEAVAAADPDWHDDILHFTKQTKRIVRVKLASVPEELRQPFLNRLAVLVRERRKTANPIRNPPAYLSKMIQEYEKGNLVLSNRAEQLEQERLEAARSAEKERKRNHEEEMRDLDHLKRMNRLRPNPEIQKQIEQLSVRLESRSDVRSIRTDSVS